MATRGIHRAVPGRHSGRKRPTRILETETTVGVTSGAWPRCPAEPPQGLARRRPRRLSLQYPLPPLPLLRPPDERVGLGRVGGPHRLVVPLDLFSGAVGHVAQVVRL